MQSACGAGEQCENHRRRRSDTIHAFHSGRARSVAVLPVAAQQYPTKTIRLVSPFPPGGSVDVVGRLRALAVTSTTRSPALPSLPTVIEAGVPGYEFLTRHGILAPKGTPKNIVHLLGAELKKILTAPGQAKLWQDRGLDVIASSPEEFATRLRGEQKKWGDVIKKRGIRPE